MSPPATVIDTNVFIAAAFSPASDSARLLDAVSGGRVRLVWDWPTRGETEALMRRIPKISWEDVRQLFVEAERWSGRVVPERFTSVADPDDRKFAALASSSGATLVTLDRHLLGAGLGDSCRVVTPSEFLRSLSGADAGNACP